MKSSIPVLSVIFQLTDLSRLLRRNVAGYLKHSIAHTITAVTPLYVLKTNPSFSGLIRCSS